MSNALSLSTVESTLVILMMSKLLHTGPRDLIYHASQKQ